MNASIITPKAVHYNTKTILERVQLTDAFDAISDGTNITRSKPDPEVFQKAAQFLGLNAENCAVIEDAFAGIDAARAAGMISVGIGDASSYDKATYGAYAAAADDVELAERVRLLNPLSFIGTEEKSAQAKHYRIRVGASDADTSLSVAMTLALKLQNAECGTVDYALVWDQPHSEADYPGDVLKWIDDICK